MQDGGFRSVFLRPDPGNQFTGAQPFCFDFDSGVFLKLRRDFIHIFRIDGAIHDQLILFCRFRFFDPATARQQGRGSEYAKHQQI